MTLVKLWSQCSLPILQFDTYIVHRCMFKAILENQYHVEEGPQLVDDGMGS